MRHIMSPQLKKTLWRLAAAVLCALPVITQAASAESFNAAVLHGTVKGNAHSDEFDKPLKELGWSFAKYGSTTVDMSKLVKELNLYDMILVCPLFNYGYKDPYLPIDYAPALARFVREGGALVLTDAVYESHTAWLPMMDQRLTIDLGSCNSPTDAAYPIPSLPYNSMPNILRIGITFKHFTLPKNTKWEVVARCGGHGAPAVVVARLGKGFVYATTFRHPNAQLLENMRANLEIQRMGLVATEFKMPNLTVGSGEVKLKLKNISNTPVELSALLSVAAPRKAPVNAEKSITLPAGREEMLSVSYDIPIRGKADASLAITSNSKNALLFKRSIVLPELLTISPPRYRGIAVASEVERTGNIRVPTNIVPYREKPEELRLKVSIRTKAGRIVGKTTEQTGLSANNLLTLTTGKLIPGDYVIESELLKTSGESLAKKKTEFQVLAAADCPVYVNDDMNLVANGEPFFPLGLYHISPKDFPNAAEIGINTIQLWSWEGLKGIDAAAALGIKVIWEQNHREHSSAIRANVPNLRNKTNLLAWYAMDEPYEIQQSLAKAITDNFHGLDKGHPTFMVSCTPQLFDSHADTADIMAVDPYPYPHRPLTLVADWMDQAWRATKGNKPVIAVLQSFGKEPEPEFRSMAYLALVHEARGIFWYPWYDNKTTGMKHNPGLQAACKKLCGEIRTLTPALLNKSGRRQFRSADSKIHGMFCSDPAGKNYLLLVNPHKQSNSIALNNLPELKNIAVLSELFGAGSVDPRHALSMKPYETRVFTVQSK